MKIGFNCLEINPNYRGGINTYTQGLISGLCSELKLESNSNWTLRLFVTKKNREIFEQYSNAQVIIEEIHDWKIRYLSIIKKILCLTFSRKIFEIGSNIIFRSLTKKISDKVDILYTPTTTIYPFNFSCTTVVSMHDIQFVHFPHFFTWFQKIALRFTFDTTAKNVNYIQASSDFIREDLKKNYSNLSKNQIQVISQGVQIERFANIKNKDIKENLQYLKLPEEFLFYPAQLWPHKNHITVLEGLLKVRDSFGYEIPLVLTGQDYAAAPLIKDFVKKHELKQIYFLGKVPFNQLICLHSKAKALISAALYEASSLCILEAAAAGTPIIAAETPPNKELGNNLSINYFKTLDANDFARVLMHVWEDSDALAAQAVHNKKNIEKYSWQIIAQQYLCWFQDLKKAEI